MKYFARKSLATELVSALRGELSFNDAHNGLFLAAPRRTGKSTFLQRELRPALEQQGVVVVYVDLWADQKRDPAVLIAAAIGNELANHSGVFAKTAKATGLQTVTVAGMKIDTANIGKIDGVTLTEALRALHVKSKSPIALIVDEAQHALTSSGGENAMAALKSARDQLNSPGHVNLMLIMSGSDRDKLLRLVNTTGAPFYGSRIQLMPELGIGFIEHVAQLVEAHRPELIPVDRSLLNQAFKTFGCRPQFFATAIDHALSPLTGLTERFETVLVQLAEDQQHQDEAHMASEYLSLTPVEQAVLWRLLDQGPRFRPYDAEALRFYKAKVSAPVSPAKAQAALESLRDRSPAMVWKSARGEYSLDDVAMIRWFEQQTTAGSWPPAAEL